MAGIDADVLAMNGAVAVAYCAAISCASDEDAVVLASIAARDAADRLHRGATDGVACDTIRHLASQGERAVLSAAALVDANPEAATKIHAIGRAVRELGPATVALARACGAAATALPAAAAAGADGTVRYRKSVRGFIGFEHLSDEERDRLDAREGMGWGWGAPDWLQQAAFLSDGSRDVREIHRFLCHEGLTVGMPALARGLAWAADQGFLQVV
jgi:hypothetical protein